MTTDRPTSRPTIGLAMIVRNEGRIIERCLESVRGFIDHWTIVDTGSRDGTPGIVRECLHGIPGAVYDRPWVDFGHNRTELLSLARGTADWLLLLDADHVVESDADWMDGVKNWADVMNVEVRGYFDFWMPYLVRGDREWKYRGATHEYLDVGPNITPGRLEGLRIRDRGDGSSHPEKYRRDVELLQRQIEQEPTVSRWMFYLGQTRQGMGDVDGALAAFRKCVELSTWDEEIYWCLLSIGELLVARGDWPDAAVALEAAWEFRPSRAESLFVLAAGHRERNMYLTARLFAEKGLEIPMPDDSAFVRRWVYEWGLRFEQSVAAWWMGDDVLARSIWLELDARDDLPPAYRDHVRDNLTRFGELSDETATR
jgi:glycosyltransferase involved in cell wall biosynthesis